MDISVYSEDIETSLWQELLLKCDQDIYKIFQTYEWAIILKECYSIKPFFLIVRCEGQLVGGQLYFQKKIANLFCAYEMSGGPLVIDNKYLNTLKEMILDHLVKISKHSIYISIRPTVQEDSQQFLNRTFLESEFYTLIIDLNKGIDLIWKSFQKNARNGIRKAVKNNIKIIEARECDLWIDFYKLHKEHSRRRNIAPKSKKFFQILYNLFFKKDMAKLFLAYKDESLIGGMLFLCYSGVMTYYIGASDDVHNDYSANDFLMWEAIKKGTEYKYDTIDLGDTWPDPQSHLYPIHKFKEKWGGQLIETSFYIKGSLYRIGRSLVLKNKTIQNIYEYLHELNLI